MCIYIFCFWSNPIFLNVDQLDCDPSPYCECSLSYLISIDGLQLALLPWQRIPKSTRWYELKWLQSQHDQSRLVEITDKAASPRVFPVQNWLSCWPLCLCFLHRDCWILFGSLWLFHLLDSMCTKCFYCHVSLLFLFLFRQSAFNCWFIRHTCK